MLYGTLDTKTDTAAAEAGAGLRMAMLEVYWDRFEPAQNVVNQAYAAEVRAALRDPVRQFVRGPITLFSRGTESDDRAAHVGPAEHRLESHRQRRAESREGRRRMLASTLAMSVQPVSASVTSRSLRRMFSASVTPAPTRTRSWCRAPRCS